MTNSTRFACGLILALGLLAGCAGEQQADDPVIIRAGTREVLLSDLVRAADGLRGPGHWDGLDSDGRREFVDLVAKKEMLVLHAIDAEGGKLNPRSEHIWNRWYERQLYRRFNEDRRASLVMRAGLLDSLAVELSKERYLVQVVCTYQEDAQDIYDRIAAGADFDVIGREYEARRPEHIHHVTVGWVQKPLLAGPIAETLFSLEEPGVANPPFETQRFGWHVVRYDSARTTTLSAQDSLVQVRGREWFGRTSQMRWREYLNEKYAWNYDFAHIGVLMRVFAAMHDSMRVCIQSGIETDWQELSTPVHRLLPEEAKLPLATWSGGTLTLGDYVSGLDEIDLDFWPTAGDSSTTSTQIMSRMRRWMEIQEAEASTTASDPDFLMACRLKRDELFIEQYEVKHAQVFAPEVSDAEVAAYWEAHTDRYLSRDLVGYAFMRFPAGNEDLAWRTYEHLQRGADMNQAATQARKTNKYVIFESGLDPTWGPPYDDVTEVALNFKPGPDGTPTITEPQPIGDDELVILRVYFRRAPETLDFETARDFVARDLQREMVESEVMGMVDKIKEKHGLQVSYDLIP